MKKLVPDYIQNAQLYPPGTPIEEVKRKLGLEDIVKLNSNENGLGPSPMAVRAIRAAASAVNLYPDNSAYSLRRKLAKKYGVRPGEVMLGNGSNELVQFILMTFLLPEEEMVTCFPTFLLYGIMGRVMGGTVQEAPLKNFCFDLDALLKKITERTKLIFISNPNNPTGTFVNADIFSDFMKALPEDVIMVVDEAYFEYVTDKTCSDTIQYVRDGRNVIVLRTFSKAYGLAGLRIGYALAPEALLMQMEKVREPFNSNTLAQKAALAALDDADHLERTLANNAAGLGYLYQQLDRLKLAYIPSQANFVAVRLGPPAGMICEKLMKRGVLVRHMKSFGMAEYVRISVGLPRENERVVRELEQALDG